MFEPSLSSAPAQEEVQEEHDGGCSEPDDEEYTCDCAFVAEKPGWENAISLRHSSVTGQGQMAEMAGNIDVLGGATGVVTGVDRRWVAAYDGDDAGAAIAADSGDRLSDERWSSSDKQAIGAGLRDDDYRGERGSGEEEELELRTWKSINYWSGKYVRCIWRWCG